MDQDQDDLHSSVHATHAVVGTELTFGSVTDKISAIVLQRKTPISWFIGFAVSFALFQLMLLAVTKRGLVRLAFPEEHPDAVLERLASTVSPRIVEARTPLEPARRELEEYFEGQRRAFELTALDRELPMYETRRDALAAVGAG